MNWIFWGIFSGLLLRAAELAVLYRSVRIGGGDFLIGLAGTVLGSLALFVAGGLVLRGVAAVAKRDWLAHEGDRFLLAVLQASVLFAIWWALRADLVSIAGNAGAKFVLLALPAAAVAIFAVLKAPLRNVPAVLPAAAGLVTVGALAAASAFGPVRFDRPERPGDRGGTDDRPNIVLILIDTLREDRLQFDRKVTRNPSIARLARSSTRFTKARSTSSWTAPSVAGILTSRYPSHHGVHHGAARLSDSERTFVETLQENGYRTAAVTANSVIGADFGYAQGFDFYLDTKNAFPFGFLLDQLSRAWKLRFEQGSAPAVHAFFHRVTRYYQHAEQVARNARAVAAGLATEDEPFFLLVHFMDPHRPYRPPLRFWREEEAVYDGPVDGFEYMKYDEEAGAFHVNGVKLTDDDVAQFLRLYDAEVRHVDAGVGRVIAGLRGAGVFEESCVILTADHGEYFGEHGLSAHSDAYAPCIDVPLLVRPPGGASAALYDGPVQTTQIPATVLTWAGLAEDAARAEFPPLPLPSIAGGASLPHVFVEAEDGPELFRRAVEKDGWKLIRGADGDELYDRTNDPLEQIDLLADGAAGESRAAVEASYRELDSLLAPFADAMDAIGSSGDEMTDAQAEALRALGYLD